MCKKSVYDLKQLFLYLLKVFCSFFVLHLLLYYTRNETKVAQPEFVDITGLMVNEH